MNKLVFRIAMICFVIGFLLTACETLINEGPFSSVIPKMTEDLTPVRQETEISDNKPEMISRFTIMADESLESALTVLYHAYFPGESPNFVETGGDLIATKQIDDFGERPEIPTRFLPHADLVPHIITSEIEDFIAYAISSEGEKALIDAGELPASITLIDQAGNKVEVQQPIHRVISTYGPATSFIYSVNAKDRLVSASYLGARDPLGASVMGKMDPRFPDIMGDEFFTQEIFNVEQAALLNPDLIVTSARTAWLETADQIGLPVFLFDAETTERLKEAMLLTGQIFSPSSEAYSQAWMAYFDAIITEIYDDTSSIPVDERPRVLFTGTQPLRVASGEMFQTDIIEAAGGMSVSSELSGYWNDVNLEQIALWNPDVIIVPPYGGASIEAITESPEWQILDAVQAGHVYQMPKLVVPWDTPTPDSVLGFIWMAQLINPDFVHVDCAEEAKYFYNTFYNYAITTDEIASICQTQ